MSLDRFRSVDIRIDKADHYFMSSQFAKGGDYNGRKLVVQITNGGLIETQAGIAVNLGWYHESVKNTGLDPFVVVDAAQGIFEISYPKEMLNPGRVTAVIQIIDGEIITETKNFVIQVEKSPVDETTIVSTNSFTVLQQALISVNSWNNTIGGKITVWEADMEATKQLYITTLNDTEAAYPQELLSLGQQLEQAVIVADTAALKADAMASGSPKGVYTTLALLQATYPTGTTGAYLVTADGKWYYWSGSAWTVGGTYQATGLADGSTTLQKLETNLQALVEEKIDTLSVSTVAGYVKIDGSAGTPNYKSVISVTPGQKYWIKCTTGWDLRPYVLLDSGGAVVGYYQTSEDSQVYHNFNVIVTIPINAVTMVINTFDNAYIGLKRFNKYEVDGADLKDVSIASGKLATGSVVRDNLEAQLTALFAEKFEGQAYTLSTGFKETTGAVNTLASARYTSFPVTSGEKWRITSNYGYNMREYVICDAGGSVLAYYPTIAYSGTKTETVDVIMPTGAVTLYVNTYEGNNIVALKKTGYKLVTDNPLYGKKAIFFGDSITAGIGSWADSATIRNNNSMTGANFGIGGSKYTVDGSSDAINNIYNRIVAQFANQPDADYVILQGGVNDAFLSVAMGTMIAADDFTTAPNTATFAGAFEAAIRYTLTNWVGKKVGFIANAKIPRLPALGGYIDMAIAICKKYSVPYLDLYNASGLSAGILSVNDAYYKIDSDHSLEHSGGTHPTPEGYALYINNKVEAFMKSL